MNVCAVAMDDSLVKIVEESAEHLVPKVRVAPVATNTKHSPLGRQTACAPRDNYTQHEGRRTACGPRGNQHPTRRPALGVWLASLVVVSFILDTRNRFIYLVTVSMMLQVSLVLDFIGLYLLLFDHCTKKFSKTACPLFFL